MAVSGAGVDKHKMKLFALANVFEKTDRILTMDRNISVSILTRQELKNLRMGALLSAPGFSSYPNIWINSDYFRDLHKTSTMIKLLGLNYHELSHILFSPREFRLHLPQRLVYPYMILEDQRIESLFTALYEPAGKYFTEMVVEFFVKREETWDTAFLFTHGRSFLPLEIRQEFRDRFPKPTVKKNAQSIIEEYKALTNSDFRGTRSVRVMELLEKFGRILNNSKAPEEQCGSQPQGGQANEEKEKEAQEIEKEKSEKEEETGEDQSGFWEDEEEEADSEVGESSSEDVDEDDSSDDGDESEASDEGEDEGDSNSAGDSEEESEGDDSSDGEIDGDGEGEEEENGGASSGAGTSPDAETQFFDEDFKDYLEEIIDAVENDEKVIEEVGRVAGAMNDLSDVNILPFGKELHSKLSTANATPALRKVTQDFRRLYAEVEPGWKYGSDHGKLNVDRAMRETVDYDEMFDEWEEGREQESGLEVFISLDMSGSMGMNNIIESASEAMWVIKRACDDVGALTTVVGFHGQTVGLFSKNERAPISYIPKWVDLGGSTLPLDSIKMATNTLHYSKMPNKLFVIITDGGWGLERNYGYSGLDIHEKALRQMDATKLYIGIGASSSNDDAKNSCDIVREINNADGLVPIIKATVENILRKSRI